MFKNKNQCLIIKSALLKAVTYLQIRNNSSTLLCTSSEKVWNIIKSLQRKNQDPTLFVFCACRRSIYKQTRKKFNIYLENLSEICYFSIYYLNKWILSQKNLHHIIRHWTVLISSIYTIFLSILVFKIFSEIDFAASVLGVVFTPLTWTSANKNRYVSNIFTRTTSEINFVKTIDISLCSLVKIFLIFKKSFLIFKNKKCQKIIF